MIKINKISRRRPLFCHICSHKDLITIGSKDFGVSGNDHFANQRMFTDYGTEITYFSCAKCGFTFTNALDYWSDKDFRDHIYNDDYLLSDPVFESERPERNANMLIAFFPDEISQLSILDFGGGNGAFSKKLSRLGCKADSFDYFHGECSKEYPIARTYDVVTSFEVIEHIPHYKQHDWMKSLQKFLTKTSQARVILSTKLLTPPISIDNWYIAPRNGHISIHSPLSLRHLANSAGMSLFSINQSMHFLSHMEYNSIFNQQTGITLSTASLSIAC